MNLEELNEKQKEAVLYNDGPLLIIAGAGAGKTKTLTTKNAYLIEEKKVSPYSILAITFTNKAAKEMKDRLFLTLGSEVKKLTVSTFHSFGLKLLRENYERLGYDRNFVIMDSDDSLTVVKKIIKDMGYDPKIYNPKAIRNKISSCKNERISPEEYDKFAVSDYERVIQEVYKKYEDKLYKNNSVDFDDLLLLPIRLFKKYPEVLERYQDLYKYILIDEYQDTNEAQYILTKLLSEKYRNITCVGDDSQSIYSFRGANYKNILNFEKDYKDAKVREKIQYYRAYNEKDETGFVVHKINELINKGIDYKDIAVLYRTNAQSRVLEEEMLKENLPYRIIGSINFYSRKEIKDLLAYLRLIHNSRDNVSLLRVINTPKRGIGLKTIENLTEKADQEETSIYEAISSGKELEFKNLIERLKEVSQNITLTELIDKVLDASGLKQELESEGTLEAEVRLENLEEFKSITKNFEEQEGLVSLEEFLLETSLVSDVEEYRNDPNRISLMTVHSVKGLEFNEVFVVGLEEGIFPHMNSLMESSDVEEERRLMYVAITRAKDHLYLVNARRRTLFGKEQINPVSRFLSEIPTSLLDIKGEEEKKEEKKLEVGEMFREEDVDYQVGDFVYHETFGTGKVVEVTNTLVSVAFKHPHGIKKLMKNHKKLSKVC